jgi:hypothetical protein
VVSRYAILLVQANLDVYSALYPIRQLCRRHGYAADDSISLQKESRTCKITVLLRNLSSTSQAFLNRSNLGSF